MSDKTNDEGQIQGLIKTITKIGSQDANELNIEWWIRIAGPNPTENALIVGRKQDGRKCYQWSYFSFSRRNRRIAQRS